MKKVDLNVFQASVILLSACRPGGIMEYQVNVNSCCQIIVCVFDLEVGVGT
jgi:hypothetical protein